MLKSYVSQLLKAIVVDVFDYVFRVVHVYLDDWLLLCILVRMLCVLLRMLLPQKSLCILAPGKREPQMLYRIEGEGGETWIQIYPAVHKPR
jgi:hypothetical protein